VIGGNYGRREEGRFGAPGFQNILNYSSMFQKIL
jgi:hypothetical protein